MSQFPEAREHTYTWDDGSSYSFRIAEETYQHKYVPAPGGTEEDHNNFKKYNEKLLEAFKHFVESGKMTKEEFNRYVNFDGHFDEDDLSFLK